MKRRWGYGLLFAAVLIFCGCTGFTTIWGTCDSDSLGEPRIPTMDLNDAFDGAEAHATYAIKLNMNMEDFFKGSITIDSGDEKYSWIEGWFDYRTRKMEFELQGDSLMLTFTKTTENDGASDAEKRTFVFVGGIPLELQGIWMLKDESLYIKFEPDSMTIAF